MTVRVSFDRDGPPLAIGGGCPSLADSGGDDAELHSSRTRSRTAVHLVSSCPLHSRICKITFNTLQRSESHPPPKLRVKEIMLKHTLLQQQ